MAIKTDMLLEILHTIRELYPAIDGVRIYASAKDILRKPLSELRCLQQAGLEMVYIGLESGSDQVLKQVNKGITKQEMILGAKQIQAAGIRQSVSIISGLGGVELMEEHMLETADALNHMQPDYLGMLVLYAGNDTKLMRKIQEGRFRLPSQQQVLSEMQLLLEHLRLNHCYFTSAHISNYIHIKGALPGEREKLLKQIDGLRKEAI